MIPTPPMPAPALQVQDHLDNPIKAVTHANPYPYYAALVANRPIYFDAELGCWVAAGAEAVTAVLSSDLCRVRPPSEPVPKALLDSSAADIFSELVRMTDGEAHHQRKAAVSAALMSVDSAQIGPQAGRWARTLRPDTHSEGLGAFGFQLPIYVVGSLLGLPDADLPSVARWMADFVACLAPTSSAEQHERGKDAATHLLDLFRRLFETSGTVDDSLLAKLGRESKRGGDLTGITATPATTATIIANAIGFLSQSYEATAGLLGNTLVNLACHPDLVERVMLEPRLLPAVLSEVVRFDPPVQNTRRFLAGDGVVAGQHMHAGDAVLVVLGAANRDPNANPDPDLFDFNRANRRSFTFGLGVHACPGETLAVTIAQAGVEHILASGIDLSALLTKRHYRPSTNTRIPLFEE